MQMRNKYYPYPVIIEDGEYYENSKFTSEVEQSMDGFNVKIKLSVSLEDNMMEQMLKQGSVVIVHHIECPQTCFRKIYKTQNYTLEVLLKDSEVNGVVQICTFIIADQDIDKYTNESFSNDYRGFKFNIEKGCIMAVGNQYNLRINKIRDDLSNTSSIFSIVPNMDQVESNLQVDLGQEKIVISLPEKTYQQYFNIQSCIDIQPMMHSMIIVPALIFTFAELRNDGDELYCREDRRWFRSLRKACKAISINLDEQGLENMNIFKVSQQLLNSPISKAVEYCSTGGGVYED